MTRGMKRGAALAAATMMLVATGCGDDQVDGGGIADGDRSSVEELTPGIVEDVDGQIHIGDTRYVNACNLLLGVDLIESMDTAFPGSVIVREAYADGGIHPGYVGPDNSVQSRCELDSLGRGDVVVVATIEHMVNQERSAGVFERLTAGTEPFDDAADSTVKVSEEHQTVQYLGQLPGVVLTLDLKTNLNSSEPEIPLATARETFDPLARQIFTAASEVDSHVGEAPDVTLGDTPLVDACTVLDAPAAEAVFADSDNLATPGAQIADPSYVLRWFVPSSGEMKPGTTLRGSCTRRSALVTDLSDGGPYLKGQGEVWLQLSYWDSEEEAVTRFERAASNGEPVDGLAAPAFLDTSGSVAELTFRHGPHVATIGITWGASEPGGDDNHDATTAEEIIPLAEALLVNLP